MQGQGFGHFPNVVIEVLGADTKPDRRVGWVEVGMVDLEILDEGERIGGGKHKVSTRRPLRVSS